MFEENQPAPLVRQAVAVLETLLMEAGPAAPLPPELAAVEGFENLYAFLAGLKETVLHFSNGDFQYSLPSSGGAVMDGCQTLQTNIRHLIRQCRSVALGDLHQRADSVGELSDAFNEMVEGLLRQNETIRRKQAELSQLTEELRVEIEEKEAMEAALRASEEMYRQKALRDPLTGLYNRGYFFDAAARELENMKRRPGQRCCVVMIDIDHFKKFNDAHGHLCGDQAIRLVADAVAKSLRKGDIFARYGGEEFVILLTAADREQGALIAERIRAAVAAQPSPAPADPTPVTVSLGVACIDAGRLPPLVPGNRILTDAVAAADAALYIAKAQGRNRVWLAGEWQ